MAPYQSSPETYTVSSSGTPEELQENVLHRRWVFRSRLTVSPEAFTAPVATSLATREMGAETQALRI